MNLWLTQHIAGVTGNVATTILTWDGSGLPDKYNFELGFQVFSKRPRRSLYDLAGKRVCIKDAIFSVLPRTRLGLFYNMHIEDSCGSSGVLRSYAAAFLHTLAIPLDPWPQAGRYRVLVSQRHHTRKVLNMDQLIETLRVTRPELHIEIVDMANLDFYTQVRLVANTDLFV